MQQPLHDKKSTAAALLDAMPSYRSRAELLAEKLVGKIDRGELQVGARLPSEQDLASYYGVSRTVVREAVARLKSAGMIESTQGRGAFVVRSEPIALGSAGLVIPRSVQGFVEFLEVRRGIESEMAALAAERRSPQQCSAIEAALDAIDQANRAGRDGVEEDMAFHLAIGAATGNVYWTHFISLLGNAMQSGIRVTRANEARRRHFAEAVAQEHRAIAAAIRSGEVALARSAAETHLRNAAARIYAADEAFWRQEGASLTASWEEAVSGQVQGHAPGEKD